MSAITLAVATLRRTSINDNIAITHIIRRVSAEYRLTTDKGYTVADPNLGELFQVYSRLGVAYQVVEQSGGVVDGDGVVPLECSEPGICELQKICFLSSARGQGLAKELALVVLEHIRKQGLKQCHLETTTFLTEAIRLCEYLSFEYISGASSYTGYADCEVQMLKPL